MPQLGNDLLGLPASTSFVPDLYASLTPKMNMLERTKNIFSNEFMYKAMHKPLINAVESVAREFLGSDFNYMKKAGETSLVFVNTDEVLDFARPITHKVIYIGGLVGSSNQAANKLPQELDNVYQKAKRGVIYMSFGTVAPSYAMPEESKRAFLEAFNELSDITFLWKYEKEDGLTKNYPNVITKAWFPQPNILSHPKTLLFISHGGMNSLAESSYSGQPILAIPLFADQFRNAHTAKWHGYGEILDKTNLTKESIVENIRRIIENKSYREKAQEMKEILSSKPFQAEDLFIKNVEFATKYNLHEHLDMYGRHLSTIEYYNVDVFGIVILATLIAIYLVYRLIRLLISCVKRPKKAKKE